jgi:hypothetical protein
MAKKSFTLVSDRDLSSDHSPRAFSVIQSNVARQDFLGACYKGTILPRCFWLHREPNKGNMYRGLPEIVQILTSFRRLLSKATGSRDTEINKRNVKHMAFHWWPLNAARGGDVRRGD